MEKIVKYEGYKKESIDIKSKASFVIFLLCVMKYFLINKLEIVSTHSPINGFVSWVIIMPLTLVGFFLSVNILRKHFERLRITYFSYNILFVTPMLGYCFYIFLLILIIFHKMTATQ